MVLQSLAWRSSGDADRSTSHYVWPPSHRESISETMNARSVSDHRHGADDEHLAQIAMTGLGDRAKALLAAA
jgi:hypothetical protein